jgi:spermidine synthase
MVPRPKVEESEALNRAAFAALGQKRRAFESLCLSLPLAVYSESPSCYNLAVKRPGFYYSEAMTEYLIREIRADKVYFQKKTKYQLVECFYNPFFGKVLFLDNKIQSAQIDEYIYHESLVHPALLSHPMPQKALVIGGGEGATLREILKHKTVRKVIMADIDRELVRLCQKYLPDWSEGAFSNPKTRLIFENARRFIEKAKGKFDIIISDLSEPVEKGPSVYLFTKEFFEKVFEALEKDGIFVLQAGSTDPYYHQFFCSLVKTAEKVFPLVRPYWTFILSFGQPWGFVLASKKYDPLAFSERELSRRIRERRVRKMKCYHPGLHKSYFALPLYLKRSLKKGKILADRNPYIWKI